MNQLQAFVMLDLSLGRVLKIYNNSMLVDLIINKCSYITRSLRKYCVIQLL